MWLMSLALAACPTARQVCRSGTEADREHWPSCCWAATLLLRRIARIGRLLWLLRWVAGI